MHLLVILLQQLLGMLPGKQPVPQAEVVRPRPAEPRNSDPASFAGLTGSEFVGAWGYWTILPMFEAMEIRVPWGADFHRRRKPAGTVPQKPHGPQEPGGFWRRAPGESADSILSPGESPGQR
jgi:hypothetical protein